MTTAVKSAEDLRTLLERMGETHAAVAEFLRAAGVTGTPEVADACPVAKWLREETGARLAEVATDTVTLRFGPLRRVDAEPPQSVAAFVRHFDEGDYRDLDDSPDEDDD